MTTHTEHCHLDSKLTLRDRTHSPLPIHAVTLSLTKQDDTLSECRLTFQVSPELYQRIETEALFNLKPELRGSLSAGDFQPEPDIQIEVALQPDLLPHLAEHTTTLEEAAAYLQNLSQEQPDNPLLSTESWFALHVKQPRESGETGYSTFWAYLNPSVITQDNISSEQITEGMVNFFKDWTDANLSELNQNTISESLEEITKAFEEWTDTTVSETQNAISEALEEVTSAFEELADTLSETTEDTTSSKQILEEIIDFFTEDDWPFTKIKGEPVLRMAFQGDNGKWTCYAKAREQQEQFVFYSICPVNAPENKRLAVAEFLTRANSGMIIGNFELDFADGEIRYKTSIDVRGDFLSFELIKQLVYANVTMMDEYLPGIKSVIESDVSPADAIAQIELAPSPPQSSATPSQPNPSAKLEKESYILSLLTTEEISQFHQAIQLQHSSQKKAAQPLLTKLKHKLTTRLGTLGESVFDQAYTLFETRQFEGKILKLIQRYAGLAARIQLLLENLPDESNQLAEAKEIEKLFELVDERLQKLATTELPGKSEIEMLMAIEEIRSQLAAWEQQHRRTST